MKRRLFVTAAALCATAAVLPLFTAPAVGAENATASGVTTGTSAPDFTLTDTNGTAHALSEFAGKTVVLEWTNKDCPFVKKFYGVNAMQGWQEKATADGVVWLTLCSSAPGKQGHMSADEWNDHIAETDIASTAVLMDEAGTVGRRYAAKTTPHIYVIDGEGVLRYQGAIDDTPSTDAADIDGATNYLAAALAAIDAGEPVQETDTRPYGCGVKY